MHFLLLIKHESSNIAYTAQVQNYFQPEFPWHTPTIQFQPISGDLIKILNS